MRDSCFGTKQKEKNKIFVLQVCVCDLPVNLQDKQLCSVHIALKEVFVTVSVNSYQKRKGAVNSAEKEKNYV